MTLLKTIETTFLLTFFTVTTFATTWAPIYPYMQKTENGKVKIHSVPYGVNDGGYGPGETFVYANGKFLYSVDKYFSSPFFTTKRGKYIVEFNFNLFYRMPFLIKDESGNITTKPIVFEGEAINIYKNGKLFKTIDFKELKIDSSKIRINKYGNRFAWNYRINDTTKDALKRKMFQHPAFVEKDKLYLITIDNQLIAIEIPTGQISEQQNAYETLKQKSNWTPTTIKRKYKKVKYPEKFLLPELRDGKTIAQGLAEHFKKRVFDRDSALIQIYVHTLLVNKEGKCEIVYISPSVRTDIKKDFNDIEYDQKLTTEFEDWIKQQRFKTTTFPRGFQKFKYKDFVYFK